MGGSGSGVACRCLIAGPIALFFLLVASFRLCDRTLRERTRVRPKGSNFSEVRERKHTSDRILRRCPESFRRNSLVEPSAKALASRLVASVENTEDSLLVAVAVVGLNLGGTITTCGYLQMPNSSRRAYGSSRRPADPRIHRRRVHKGILNTHGRGCHASPGPTVYNSIDDLCSGPGGI
jgi:hypothetical protein